MKRISFALAIALTARRDGRERAAVAQRVVRSDARAVSAVQRRLREVLARRRPARTSRIRQAHGGSGAQARAVIDGLEADVVTLALAYDIDAIAQSGLIDPKWQSRLPNNSAPYTSTIVFLVRKGNPKGIKDWDDLIKPGVGSHHRRIRRRQAVRAGPIWLPTGRRCSGTARTTRRRANTSRSSTPTRRCSTPARAAATTTFVQRGIGDVLVGWENEAYSRSRKLKGKVDIVVPSQSILAEPPVAVVDKVVAKKGTRVVAEAYLQVPLHPGRPGDRREESLPSAGSEGAREIREHVREDEAVYARRAVRRLDQGAEDALCRQGRIRSDLQAEVTRDWRIDEFTD